MAFDMIKLRQFTVLCNIKGSSHVNHKADGVSCRTQQSWKDCVEVKRLEYNILDISNDLKYYCHISGWKAVDD